MSTICCSSRSVVLKKKKICESWWGIKTEGGKAAFKHWVAEEEFPLCEWHKSKIRGSSAERRERNLVELTARSRVFWEEEKTRDRAIILEIWRVKIKLPDNKQSEMNQFWKYMLMHWGLRGGGDKEGCQCFNKWLGIRQQAFGNIGLYSQTVSLPAALYLCTDHIRGCIRSTARCHFFTVNVKDQ